MLKNKFVQIVFQIFPLVILIAAVLMIFFSKNQFTVKNLLTYTPGNYLLALLFLLFLYIIKGFSIILPVSVLHIVSGVIFPLPLALLLNTVGTGICLAVGYCIGFYSLSNYAVRMVNKYPKVKAVVERQRKNEWFSAYILRVIPISGDVVSIYLGSLKFRFPRYLAAGVIGSVPGIIVTTLLGNSINDPLSPRCIAAFAMLALILVISFIVNKMVTKNKSE